MLIIMTPGSALTGPVPLTSAFEMGMFIKLNANWLIEPQCPTARHWFRINRLLWRAAWAAIRGRRIIAVGVQLGNVEFLSNRNGDMLRQLPAAAKTRGERAAAAVDFINGRFGTGAITYGVNQPHPGFFERG